MIHPWVTWLASLRLFSMTSTPNCRMSPLQTSLAGLSSDPLLSLWLLTKVPLLDLVSTGLARATDRPTLTDWSRPSILSWKGCEFGLQMRLARGTPLGEEASPPLVVSAGMIKSD